MLGLCQEMDQPHDLRQIVNCPQALLCSGCDFLGEPLHAQLSRKATHLRSLLQKPHQAIDLRSPGPAGLRDRLDFTLEDGRLGLKERGAFRILDLPSCPQLSPPLEAWLQDFRKNLPPIQKGSVRLRVAPDGQRGLWLDFSNIDIKRLLDEGEWLLSLAPELIIEIGQKRKRLDRSGSRLKLSDPELYPWFQTTFQDRQVPTWGYIGSFTQPSLIANLEITSWINAEVTQRGPRRITEFGSGQGNLSLPALSSGAHLTACEFDRKALQGFEKSLEELAKSGIDLREKVSFEAGDFLRKTSASLKKADLLIANPPRSGLEAFADPLPRLQNLQGILYMSCHPESFAKDVPRLEAAGFQLDRLQILDQFPQSRHYEILSSWSREKILT